MVAILDMISLFPEKTSSFPDKGLLPVYLMAYPFTVLLHAIPDAVGPCAASLVHICDRLLWNVIFIATMFYDVLRPPMDTYIGMSSQSGVL